MSTAQPLPGDALGRSADRSLKGTDGREPISYLTDFNGSTLNHHRSTIHQQLWHNHRQRRHVRKKGFGPGETQVALGNFPSLKEYLTTQASPGVFVKVTILQTSLGVNLGISRCLCESYNSLYLSGCLSNCYNSPCLSGCPYKSLECFESTPHIWIFGSLKNS